MTNIIEATSNKAPLTDVSPQTLEAIATFTMKDTALKKKASSHSKKYLFHHSTKERDSEEQL